MEESRYVLRNPSGREIRVVLEPWGDAYVMPRGATLTIVARAPEPGVPEFDVRDGAIVIFGWVGSTIDLFEGSRNLRGAVERLPVPPIPSGMSVSGFLDMVFGNSAGS